MLLAPLCAGQTLLALTASLVPQRFFTLVTMVFTLLACAPTRQSDPSDAPQGSLEQSVR